MPSVQTILRSHESKGYLSQTVSAKQKTVLALVTGLVAIALAALWLLKATALDAPGQLRPFPRLEGIGWVPAISFAELEKAAPFTATVKSRTAGIWNPPADAATGKTKEGDRPAQYIAIILLKANGRSLAIGQDNATSNDIAFMSSLRDGGEYAFPAVYSAWQRAQSTNAAPLGGR